MRALQNLQDKMVTNNRFRILIVLMLETLWAPISMPSIMQKEPWVVGLVDSITTFRVRIEDFRRLQWLIHIINKALSDKCQQLKEMERILIYS